MDFGSVSSQRKIERQLRELLRSLWPPGTQLPSASVLAQRLGTGQRNTQKAMQALARAGYLVSRQRIGTFVVRTPPPEIASRMAGGLMVEEASGHVRDFAVPGATSALAGKRVLILGSNNPTPTEMKATLRARLENVCAIVDCAPGRKFDANSSDLEPYCKTGVDGLILLFPTPASTVRFDGQRSVVILANTSQVRVRASQGFDVVGPDDQQGAVLAGEFAAHLDGRRPCFIGVAAVAGEQFDTVSQCRLDAFEEGLGVGVADEHRLIADKYTENAGRRMAAVFAQLNPRPDIVFTATDDLALGLMKGTAALGVEAGRDYQLVGFDGQRAGKEILGGPLTTIAQPEARLTELAAEMLIGRLQNPQQLPRRILLGCTLFAGATTRLSSRVAADHLQRTGDTRHFP